MNPLTPYPITPIGSFIGFVMALLPLISQIRKLSIAVWGYAIWIAAMNLQTFVNTIIWHDNVNVVVPVWCDIVIKLQVGAGIGTRACALVICIHLYKVTRLRASVENTKGQRRKALIYELFLIIGLPFFVMALFIIIQPFRFNIVEEEGCAPVDYSYVGYIVLYAPEAVTSLGCAILAPLVLRTFLRHRKEMNEFLSSGQGLTHNKYFRLMVVACLDTLFNLPVLITAVVTSILAGKVSLLNHPYISWQNVHDGAEESSLSTILATPASVWGSDKWSMFNVKWDEWVYVLHAVIFFSVFGTTPEMRQYYKSAFWFIPERCGYKRQRVSEVETVSDVAFNSNPGQQAGNRPTTNRRRGSLSFLETTIDTRETRSRGVTEGNSLTSGVTSTGTNRAIETVAVFEGYEDPGAGWM